VCCLIDLREKDDKKKDTKIDDDPVMVLKSVYTIFGLQTDRKRRADKEGKFADRSLIIYSGCANKYQLLRE